MAEQDDSQRREHQEAEGQIPRRRARLLIPAIVVGVIAFIFVFLLLVSRCSTDSKGSGGGSGGGSVGYPALVLLLPAVGWRERGNLSDGGRRR